MRLRTHRRQGRLVTKDGYQVEPGIEIPPAERAERLDTASGVVEITTADNAQPQEVGRIQLTRFVNKSGLESIGDNLFLQTAASGDPVQGNPNEEGYGSLHRATSRRATSTR